MTVARLLGRVESRLILSAAIIVSLLPFDWVTKLDGPFFLLFSFEFLLRVILIFRSEARYAHSDPEEETLLATEQTKERGWQWPSVRTLILLVFDLLALLSFVPSLVGLETDETHWLRLFRLSRMLLLLSYWAPLLGDLWLIMRRQERTQQVVLMGLVVLAMSFAGAVVIDQLHHGEASIDYDGDQIYGYDARGEAIDADDTRFFVHLWWAFRQIQDPGNMLSSPKHAAAVVVSVVLTIFGLFLVSFLIGLGTDVVRELMALSRLRPPGLRGHTIIVNLDASTQALLHELIRYSRKLLPAGTLSLDWVAQLLRNTKRGLRAAHFVVVGRNPEPPDFLRQSPFAHLIYRQGHIDEEAFQTRTDVAEATRVVLLADLRAADPDADTIQALLTITGALREADARRRSGRRRARLLIAEVLDESNVPAARAAITGDGHGHTRAFVVPSERLIAQFIACVTTRPGVGRVLEELLTSSGHELYTLYFNLSGLGYQREQPRDLSRDPSVAMRELLRRARSLPSRVRVIPIGMLVGCEGGECSEVHLNPDLGERTTDLAEGDLAEASETTADAEATETPPSTDGEPCCVGFVALADNFKHVRELAEDFHLRPGADVPEDAQDAPDLGPFVRAEPTKLERVLVCSFRNGTVGMIEALIQSEPSTQILLMVRHESALAAVWDDFDAHTRLVERQLLRGHHGRFEADQTRSILTWRGPDGAATPQRPHVYVAVGDWSSSRQLTSLPFEFGHVKNLDAVMLMSDESEGADARTAKTLMKLETLTTAPRVTAEVLDVEFARRLRRRTDSGGSDRVSVYSIQELRAFFMFQSVVVPSFDLVYAELMGPWGESLVRLFPDAPLRGTCSFDQLGMHLSRSNRALIAVELCAEQHVHGGERDCRTEIHVGGPQDIALGRLVSVWVVSSQA
jgi:hypothetical protein